MEENKKVIYIFLDIDGVLDNEGYIKLCHYKHKKPMSMRNIPFDPRCVEYLKILYDMISKYYECRIVLSSTWRLNNIDTAIVEARLCEYGLRLYGATPDISHDCRGKEIQEYLNTRFFKDWKDIIILDDEDFDIKEYFPNNLVKTSFEYGLTFKEVEKAIDILGIGEEF